MNNTISMNVKNLTLTNYKNIINFSEDISYQYQCKPYSFACHVFCMLSMSLTTLPEARADIQVFFNSNTDELASLNTNSSLTEYLELPYMRLENEFSAKQVLSILTASETSIYIRTEFIKILKKFFPGIYKAAKNNNFKHLISTYQSIQDFCLLQEAAYDRCIFFYFIFYINPEKSDIDMIYKIVYSALQYEAISPLNIDFENEYVKFNNKINKIKTKLEKYLKAGYGYSDILLSPEPLIEETSIIYENLFCINKIHMNHLFTPESIQEIPNDILLALAQSTIKPSDESSLVRNYIGCVFVKELMKEYIDAKDFYQNKIFTKTNDKVSDVEVPNNKIENKSSIDDLKHELKILRRTIEELKNKHSKELDNLNRASYNEQIEYKKKIEDLTSRIEQEKLYHQELYRLRELLFNKTTNPITEDALDNDINLILSEALNDKYIITVGGAKNWRYKLMNNYPQIRSISASNLSIDLSSFKNADCILFFTDHISHSVYNRVMNYVRSNQINFGYIKNTNFKLLQKEIYDVLKRCRII